MCHEGSSLLPPWRSPFPPQLPSLALLWIFIPEEKEEQQYARLLLPQVTTQTSPLASFTALWKVLGGQLYSVGWLPLCLCTLSTDFYLDPF